MFPDTRKCFYFGTENYMQWISTPLQGAEMSPEGWSSGGVLLNGGGYQFNSWGSHKTYTFEWPQSSSQEMAQLMKTYADGTYGRGLIYFLDPLIYDKNVLPARWADPSMAINDEGAGLIAGLRPTSLVATDWKARALPMQQAVYQVTVPAGFRGREDAVFIPIPPGFRLSLGAVHSYTGTAGVFYVAQNSNGTTGNPIRVPAINTTAPSLVTTHLSGVDGVWLYIGRTSTATSSITLHALTAVLSPLTDPYPVVNKWTGGMGHSGTRFQGKPTYIANSAVNGGQVSYAASFREVGDWVYG